MLWDIDIFKFELARPGKPAIFSLVNVFSDFLTTTESWIDKTRRTDMFLSLLVALTLTTVITSIIIIRYRLLYFSYPVTKPSQGAIIITGVSSGIGRALSWHLAKKGFFVIGTVRNQKDAMDIREKQVQNIHPIILDVTKEKSIVDGVEEVASLLEKKRLKLAGLINNAGVNPEAEAILKERKTKTKAIWPQNAEVASFVYSVNVVGVIRMINHFLPQLKTSKGRIVNISSYFGTFIPLRLKQIAYGSSKFAVEAISDGYRRGLQRKEVAVCIVKPGNFKTEMNPVGGDPSLVADAVFDALTSSRPYPRYYVGDVFKMPMYPLCTFLHLAPEYITDRIL